MRSTQASVFDEVKLLALLANNKAITRLKGVFRAQDEWIAVNRAGTAASVSPTAYRRDSRLEVLADGVDWDTFEREWPGSRGGLPPLLNRSVSH